MSERKEGFWSWYYKFLRPTKEALTSPEVEGIAGFALAGSGFVAGLMLGLNEHPSFFALMGLILVGFTIIGHAIWRDENKPRWR